ncbi:uncharacterized protein LOC142538382 [Primulina tabacum]|uniref:uncharacterized protein LOC142538382 n=1 Tax=Primulina tabacum TaxID=48773 RepID=UPI003F595A5C
MREAESMKRKIVPRLNSLLKRGKLASTAIGKVLQHCHQLYYSNLTCRSEEVHLSFVSPGDYEFSCSNSPAYPSYPISKPRNRGNKRGLLLKCNHRQIEQIIYNSVVVASPSMMRLPGFGHSPEVRQLRVTDSPFSVKDTGEDDQVDMDAEEFIQRFYKELENQSPSSWL